MGRTRPTTSEGTEGQAERPRALVEAENSGRFHPLAIELYELLLGGGGATVDGIASKPGLRSLRFARAEIDEVAGSDYLRAAAAVRVALAHESKYVMEKLRQRDKSGADRGKAVRCLLALEPDLEAYPLSDRRGWAAAELGESVRTLTKTRYDPYRPSKELKLMQALAARIWARESAHLALVAASDLLASHSTANPTWAPPWFVAVAEITDVIHWLRLYVWWALVDLGRLETLSSPSSRYDDEHVAAAPETSLFLLGLFWRRVRLPVRERPLADVDAQLFPSPEVAGANPQSLPLRAAALLPFTISELEKLVSLVSTSMVSDVPMHPDALRPFNPNFDLGRFAELTDEWRQWLSQVAHRRSPDCSCNSCQLLDTLESYSAFLGRQWNIVREEFMASPANFSAFRRGDDHYGTCGLRAPEKLVTFRPNDGNI